MNMPGNGFNPAFYNKKPETETGKSVAEKAETSVSLDEIPFRGDQEIVKFPASGIVDADYSLLLYSSFHGKWEQSNTFELEKYFKFSYLNVCQKVLGQEVKNDISRDEVSKVMEVASLLIPAKYTARTKLVELMYFYKKYLAHIRSGESAMVDVNDILVLKLEEKIYAFLQAYKNDCSTAKNEDAIKEKYAKL